MNKKNQTKSNSPNIADMNNSRFKVFFFFSFA